MVDTVREEFAEFAADLDPEIASHNEIGSRVYHDVQLRARAGEHMDWFIGVNNLFDRKPPKLEDTVFYGKSPARRPPPTSTTRSAAASISVRRSASKRLLRSPCRGVDGNRPPPFSMRRRPAAIDCGDARRPYPWRPSACIRSPGPGDDPAWMSREAEDGWSNGFSDITASMAVCLAAGGAWHVEQGDRAGDRAELADGRHLSETGDGAAGRVEPARGRPAVTRGWENGGNPPSQKSEPPLPALGSPPEAPAQTGSTDGGSAASPRFLPPVGGSLNDLSWDQKRSRPCRWPASASPW